MKSFDDWLSDTTQELKSNEMLKWFDHEMEVQESESLRFVGVDEAEEDDEGYVTLEVLGKDITMSKQLIKELYREGIWIDEQDHDGYEGSLAQFFEQEIIRSDRERMMELSVEVLNTPDGADFILDCLKMYNVRLVKEIDDNHVNPMIIMLNHRLRKFRG